MTSKEAKKDLFSLIERDTPKRVVTSVLKYGCPACKMPLFAGENYCSNCGQKLDWSLENE